MTDDDDWVTVAKTDNSLVAEILIRLSQPPPPPSKSHPPKLEWSVRQRRSSPPALRKINKEGDQSTRASPSTPLSWSDDGTSLTSSAGGGDGGYGGGCVEESSLEANARPIESLRSKLAVANESVNTKRCRRKKTLAQLRDQESFLLDERRGLTSKLTPVYRKIERLRGSNENLKKMKLNLQSQSQPTGKFGTTSVASEETISDQLQQMDAEEDQACSNSATSAVCNNSNLSLPIKSSKAEEPASYKQHSFVLPDLNLPFEDEFNEIS